MKRNPGGSEFRIQNQFTKYLQRAAIRAKGKYLAKKYRQQEFLCHGGESVSFDEMLHRGAQGDARVSEIEQAYEMSSILEKLPDRAQAIIRLRVYHKCEFYEIASITGMTYVNVRNIYYRTLRQLRREIDE